MSEVNVLVDFSITGYGSADCNLHIGDKKFTLQGLSYTTDALGDLLRMALEIATGAVTATARFDHEPMESRLWAHNLGGRSGLFLKVLRFSDIYGNEPDHAGDIVFAAECGAADFANAVVIAAKRVWETYGPNYKWSDNPFPMRALRALETALATEDPPVPPQDPDTETFIVYAPKND